MHSSATGTDKAALCPGNLQDRADESKKPDAHTRLHKPQNDAGSRAGDLEKRQGSV